MKSVVGLRFWIALALGVAVAAVAHDWSASPRAVVRHDHIGWHLAFSHDGTKLALLDREAGLNPQGQVLVWDAATGRLLHRFDTGNRPYPGKVVFAPDDRSLGVIDAGPVTRWDLATGRIIAHHDHAAWSHDADHYSGREILFSSAGRWLAHDVHDGRVYDVETGRVVVDYAERWPDRSLHAHDGRVAALVDGEVKTFDVLTGDAVGTFPSGANRPPMARTAFTFSPDGTRGVLFTDRWVLADGVDGRRLALDGSL